MQVFKLANGSQFRALKHLCVITGLPGSGRVMKAGEPQTHSLSGTPETDRRIPPGGHTPRSGARLDPHWAGSCPHRLVSHTPVPRPSLQDLGPLATLGVQGEIKWKQMGKGFWRNTVLISLPLKLSFINTAGLARPLSHKFRG